MAEAERARFLDRAAAAQELAARGVELGVTKAVAVGRQHLDQPIFAFRGRPRAAPHQNRAPLGHQLGLEEHAAERAVRDVGAARRKHRFGVAGDVQVDRFRAVVRERETSHLCRMLGRHDDLHHGFDGSVAALDLDAIDRERSVVVVRNGAGRLLSGGPQPTTG